MKIKEMDLEQLLWMRDTSEEALSSEMFKDDKEYFHIHREVDERISREIIERVEL